MATHTRYQQLIYERLIPLRRAVLGVPGYKPELFVWDIDASDKETLSLPPLTLGPSGLPALDDWTLGQLEALIREILKGCVHARVRKSAEDSDRSEMSQARMDQPILTAPERLRERLIDTIENAIGRPIVPRRSMHPTAVLPLNARHTRTNGYEWKFSNEYPTFPTTQGGMAHWPYVEIENCEQALDQGFLRVVAVNPRSMEAEANPRGYLSDGQEVSISNLVNMAIDAVTEAVELDDMSEEIPNVHTIPQSNGSSIAPNHGHIESGASSNVNVSSLSIDDVPFFKREIDDISESAANSRDMMNGFGSLQTQMLEAVVSKRCQELKASLKVRHAAEISRLKDKLDSIRQKLRSEKFEKQSLEVELEKMKVELATERRRQEHLPIELSKANSQLEMMNTWNQEIKRQASEFNSTLISQQKQHGIELQKLRDESTSTMKARQEQYDIELRRLRDALKTKTGDTLGSKDVRRSEDIPQVTELRRQLVELQNALTQSDAAKVEDLRRAKLVGHTEAVKGHIENLDVFRKKQVDVVTQARTSEREIAKRDFEKELGRLQQSHRVEIAKVRGGIQQEIEARHNRQVDHVTKVREELQEAARAQLEEEQRKHNSQINEMQQRLAKSNDLLNQGDSRVANNIWTAEVKKVRTEYEHDLDDIRQSHAKEIEQARVDERTTAEARYERKLATKQSEVAEARREYAQRIEDYRQRQMDAIAKVREEEKDAAQQKFSKDLAAMRQSHAEEIKQARIAMGKNRDDFNQEQNGEKAQERKEAEIAAKQQFVETLNAVRQTNVSAVSLEDVRQKEPQAATHLEAMLLASEVEGQEGSQHIGKQSLTVGTIGSTSSLLTELQQEAENGHSNYAHIDDTRAHQESEAESPQEPVFEEGTLNQIPVPSTETRTTVAMEEVPPRGLTFSQDIWAQVQDPIIASAVTPGEYLLPASTKTITKPDQSQLITAHYKSPHIALQSSLRVEKDYTCDTEPMSLSAPNLATTRLYVSTYDRPEDVHIPSLRAPFPPPTRTLSSQPLSQGSQASINSTFHLPSEADDSVEAHQVSSREGWTLSDEHILIASRTQGMKWDRIQQIHFPTRTPIACKRKYSKLTTCDQSPSTGPSKSIVSGSFRASPSTGSSGSKVAGFLRALRDNPPRNQTPIPVPHTRGSSITPKENNSVLPPRTEYGNSWDTPLRDSTAASLNSQNEQPTSKRALEDDTPQRSAKRRTQPPVGSQAGSPRFEDTLGQGQRSGNQESTTESARGSFVPTSMGVITNEELNFSTTSPKSRQTSSHVEKSHLPSSSSLLERSWESTSPGPPLEEQSDEHPVAGSQWTSKDLQLLLDSRAQGMDWHQIRTMHFPTRTVKACKRKHWEKFTHSQKLLNTSIQGRKLVVEVYASPRLNVPMFEDEDDEPSLFKCDRCFKRGSYCDGFRSCGSCKERHLDCEDILPESRTKYPENQTTVILRTLRFGQASRDYKVAETEQSSSEEEKEGEEEEVEEQEEEESVDVPEGSSDRTKGLLALHLRLAGGVGVADPGEVAGSEQVADPAEVTDLVDIADHENVADAVDDMARGEEANV